MPDPRLEPTFQGSPLPSLGKDENPETEFAQNDGIDGDIGLMRAKPRHDPRIGSWFVASLRTLASTKYFTAHPSTQSPMGTKELVLWTGE